MPSLLPVGPAAVGQSDICNLGNEQKSIPLRQCAVGHVDVQCVVDSWVFFPPSFFFVLDFLCVIDTRIEVSVWHSRI